MLSSEGRGYHDPLLLTQFLGKGDARCPYLPPLDDEVRMLDFRDQVLVNSVPFVR